MSMTYFCCDQNRRDLVLASTGALNGIDFLEVQDDPAMRANQRQRTLSVHFLKPLVSIGILTKDNFRLTGGERIRDVAIVTVLGTAEPRMLLVTVDKPGDFSIYTLSLVRDSKSSEPPDDFDPQLSAVDFSFKVGCPSDFDCRVVQVCPTEPQPTPDIDYLAKDFASFRQLMLDRMAALLPRWQDRNAADLGVTLVELLAYIGDRLSYEQDAVATEAYLNTARRRVSVRRHARLVDYFMHDGSNARVWVQLFVEGQSSRIQKGTRLLTASIALPGPLAPSSTALDQALRSDAEVFETMHDVLPIAANNEIQFYTWGDGRCCLPKGATQATLLDHPDPEKRLLLCIHDVLIFEEQFGPKTGNRADADPMKRHAVRLTRVVPEAIPVPDDKGNQIGRSAGQWMTDPLTGQGIVEISWSNEDALPFPLCISVAADNEHGELPVSVALGNIVLADHGASLTAQPLGTVPQPSFFRATPVAGDRCNPVDATPVPPRFRPRLQNAPLTMAATVELTQISEKGVIKDIEGFDPVAPAAAAFKWDQRSVLPVITATSTLTGSWGPKRDLLASDPIAREFVVEVEEDGFATLRFGDGTHGQSPKANESFSVAYRIGNGVRGNVGRESIVNIVTKEPAVRMVRNPLPARGGTDPEKIEQVRQNAPSAFRTQERAVTPADYAEVAERHGEIQQAAATFRWTGSWRTVFLTIDRLGGLEVNTEFKTEMRAHMERYRMAGHDLEIDGPLYVSLDIDMTVTTKSGHLSGEVKSALLGVFSNRLLTDGTRGVFHPDNFSFGQPVYLSPFYAAAMKVEGVASVTITTFQRQASPDPAKLALRAGKLTLSRLEIARLDNDPNFPERGVLRLKVEGGK